MKRRAVRRFAWVVSIAGALAGFVMAAPTYAQGRGPSISIDPPGGLCFSTQVVHGIGFPPDTPLVLLVGSPPGSELAVDSEFVSGHDGTFNQPLSDTFRAVCTHLDATSTSPAIEVEAGPGRYPDGHRADFDATTAIATFTKASLTLTPSSGPCDTTVTVNGRNLPDAAYRLTLEAPSGNSGADVPGSVTAMGGEFVTTIPASALKQACGNSSAGAVVVSLEWLAPADPGPQVSAAFTIGPRAPDGGSGVAPDGSDATVWMIAIGTVCVAVSAILGSALWRSRMQ